MSIKALWQSGEPEQSIQLQNPIMLTSDQLIDALSRLDVHFLSNTNQPPIATEVDPSLLFFALAGNNEARLRLAIIPLLLRHPEFAPKAQFILEHLPQESQIVLKCYYTAACLLQQKYLPRLQALFSQFNLLPDFFAIELGLEVFHSIEDKLVALAQRHRSLSGRSINWLGTYEHGAQRFLIHYEHRQSWQKLR